MRVNIDGQALTEPRIRRMAKRLQLSHYDVLGRLTHVWSVCYERHDEFLPEADIDIACGEVVGFVEAMIAEEMGDRVDPKTIRVRGVELRVQHLERQSMRGRLSGIKRRAMSDELQKRTIAQQAFALGSTNGGTVDNFGSTPHRTFSDQIRSDHIAPHFVRRDAREAPPGDFDDDRVEPAGGSKRNAHRANGEHPGRVRAPRELVPEVSEHASALASLLVALVTANHANGRLARSGSRLKQASAIKWSVELQRLHLTYGFEWAHVEDMIRWSQADPFWSTVVLGAAQLVENWDQMAAQRRRPKGPQSAPSSNGDARPGPTELARREVEALERKAGA